MPGKQVRVCFVDVERRLVEAGRGGTGRKKTLTQSVVRESCLSLPHQATLVSFAINHPPELCGDWLTPN